MKIIKNIDSVDHVWSGTTIVAGGSYTIPEYDYFMWANASDAISAVASGLAIMNDGISDITNVSEGVNLLKSNVPKEVITQFEKKDYVLQLACGSGDVSGDGTATILMKIPGTPGSSDGRVINAGETFFDVATPGDKIIGVWFIDHDNLLGQGADYIVGSYTDDAADADNQGWYIPHVRGFVKAETVGFYGFAPSGFYMKIVGKKGGGITTGKLYLNMEWAIKST